MLLNGAAIVVAFVLTLSLSGSDTVAAQRGPRVATNSPAAVSAPAPAPVIGERTVAEPQVQPDRNGDRGALDADDTLPAPPPPGPGQVKANSSDFVSPVPGPITGGFGQRFHPILHYWRMHNGVDMHAACGTPVIAAYRGTVVQAGPNGGYGNLVVIDHGVYKGKHVLSKYAHLSRIGVRVGDRVDTAQGIALSGTTGLSTGCHLHFEIKENGVYVDPAPYLTGKPSPRPSGPIPNLGPRTSPSPSPSGQRPSVTPSASPSSSPKPSTSPRPSSTPKPSTTPKPSVSPSPSSSPTPSPTPSVSQTPSPSPGGTDSPGTASARSAAPSGSSTP